VYKLRLMTTADRELVREWRNRPSVRVNMYTHHLISVEEHRNWFAAALQDPAKRLLMCVDENEVPVGVVVFYDINAAGKTSNWAFYAGEPARRGVGPQMELLALDYAFGELGLEKLNCEVLGFNKVIVDFHRKHGFRIEGIFRSQYVREGERYDVYRLAHFRKAWLEDARPRFFRKDLGSGLRLGATHRERLKVTRDLIDRFSEFVGDRPVPHVDELAGSSEALNGATAHGMLVAADISRILRSTFPGPGTVHLHQTWQFLRPIHPDSELEYVVRILSLIGRQAILATTVLDHDGELIATGEAEVLLSVKA
jgi:UDP-4-amino-4,6-dideoxy-N-acetyl-beta-L-altrosamine N-acetyltransferase